MSNAAAVACSEPSKFPFFNSVLPEDTVVEVLNYLEPQDLRVVDCVSPFFRQQINTACQELCKSFIPANLPFEVSYKQLWLHQLPKAIGFNYFLDHLRKKDIVPIPQNYLVERPGFKRQFTSKYIPITVGTNSSLMLDDSFAVEGKKARLIEDPERAPKKARTIQVPITPNNIILLTQKYLKENSQFAGIDEGTCENVLDQHGDIGVERSHWSYQKEGAVELGESYHSRQEGQERIKGQEEIARDTGLEIVPLTDRILFYLLPYINSGKALQNYYVERTSTPTLDNDGNSWQSSIFWLSSGSLFRLSLLLNSRDCCFVGAAVGVPAGSSKAMGH